MDRRSFLTAVVGVAGATALAGVASRAQAAPLAAPMDASADDFFKKLGEDGDPTPENVQYYYYRRRYRRRRYRCYVRRTYWGWRRVCRWW